MTLPRDSIAEIRRLIRQHDAFLREIAANTRNTRNAHAVQAPESILLRDDEHESVFSQVIASKDVDDSFETVILGTKVYSNAFTDAIGPADDDDKSDDAKTVVDAPIRDVALRSARTDASELSNLAIHDPSIQSAVEGLEIVDIYASPMLGHQAASNEELSYKTDQEIHGIRKISQSRYYGYTTSRKGGKEKKYGYFERDHVEMKFVPRQRLQASASNTFAHRDGRNIYVEHVSMNIDVSLSIAHHAGV